MPELYSISRTTTGQRVLCLGGRPLITLNRSPLYEKGDGLDTPEQRDTFAAKLAEKLNYIETHFQPEEASRGAYAFVIALTAIVAGGIGLCAGMLLI